MMKKPKSKPNLSDKISAALTVQPRPDPEDDVIFRTKPQILTRDQFDGSDDEADISEFRRRNVQLLSDLGDKYKGEIVSNRNLNPDTSDSDSDVSNDGENIVSSTTDVLRADRHSDEGASSGSDEGEIDESITQSKKTVESDVSDVSDKSGSEAGSDKSASEADSGDESNDSDASEDEEGYDISQMEEPPKESFEHMAKRNVSEEVKKGNSVRSQLLLWEGLLEMRIHMQRCVNTANQMPAPDAHRKIKQRGGREFAELSDKTRDNVARLLDKLLTLQNILLKNFPDTKSIPKSSGGAKQIESQVKPDSDEEIPSDDEEIPSDTDDEGQTESKVERTDKSKDAAPPAKRRKLQDYENEIAATHQSFAAFKNATIQKWNDKTRLTAAASRKNAPTNPILSQIDFILSDRSKLVRRTQLKRSEYQIVGYNKDNNEEKSDETDEVEINPSSRDRKDDDEYIPEIFDDSDFYHQMLRELIECKSADISDPVQLSRQWIALQQMRSKMKRKVDTKATKGRRIKYVVHNKLVNFMAPDAERTWSDDTTNELYASLFGKMFESNATEYTMRNRFTLTGENGV